MSVLPRVFNYCQQLRMCSINNKIGNVIPLNLVTWNVDLYRTPPSTAPDARIGKIIELFQEERILAEVDMVLLQESTTELAELVNSRTAFRWVDKAQARTYHGYLQAFTNSARHEWRASIAWPFTCLTMDLTHRFLYDRQSKAKSRASNWMVRLSNVQLDSAEKNRILREQSLAYLRDVPRSDIIIGDGAFRRDDQVEGYADAFLMAGQPYSQRYTIDTYENKYWAENPRPYAARYSRCYIRQGNDRNITTISRVSRYEVLKRYVRTDPVPVGASDHYALHLEVEVTPPTSLPDKE